MNDRVDELPLCERLYLDRYWRVAHRWSALPGWLVVGLRRHAEAVEALSIEEATGLGLILRAASLALKDAVGCTKPYVMLFAEREGYSHVHVHLVPRMEWFTAEDTAVGVFRFLNVPPEEQVSVNERERLAAEIGQSVRYILG